MTFGNDGEAQVLFGRPLWLQPPNNVVCSGYSQWPTTLDSVGAGCRS